MSRPSLHEILKKHRKKGAERKMPKKDLEPAPKARHVVLTAPDARALFMDLPKDHKFWLAGGKEINNLSELYRAIIEMSAETFSHHVSPLKNDFAMWVNDVLGDTVVARKLNASQDKVEHAEILMERINELKYRDRRLPRPHSLLDPDYSFIKIERPRAPVAHRTLETRFKIQPRSLSPDTSFIQVPHARTEASSRFDRIMEAQAAVITTVKKDIAGKVMLETEVQGLTDKFEKLSSQLAGLQKEIGSLKSDLNTRSEIDSRKEDEKLDNIKDSIRQLRSRELTLLSELKKIGKSEERILGKSSQLMDKEKSLAEKEAEVLKREAEYAKLMKNYNEMLRKLETRMSADEHRISALLSKNANHESHAGKPVHEMLGKTHSAKESATAHVEKLILEAKHSLAQKQYAKARHSVDQVRDLLEKSHLDKDFKKSVYFQILELSTDIDLKTK